MEILLQWSFPAQDLLLPFGAVLMARVSLHVSLCKLHECNNNNDNYYTMNSGDTVADVNAIFQSTELGLISAAKYLDT